MCVCMCVSERERSVWVYEIKRQRLYTCIYVFMRVCEKKLGEYAYVCV